MSGRSTEGWFYARPRYDCPEVLEAKLRKAGIMVVHYIQGSGGLRQATPYDPHSTVRQPGAGIRVRGF
jgi:hypothetical protein